MSPDWSGSPEAVPYANLQNPQSLNLYVYGGNNPISGFDADGHDPQPEYASQWDTGYEPFMVSAAIPATKDPPKTTDSITVSAYAPSSLMGVISVTSQDFVARNPLTPRRAPRKQPWDANLPNCWAVGGKAVLQAGADTAAPIVDALGALQQIAQDGLNMASEFYNNKAGFYSATKINTAGTVGLLVPLRSSVYRGLLSTSETLAKASAAVPLGFFDYYLGKQIVNEVKNPTPCK